MSSRLAHGRLKSLIISTERNMVVASSTDLPSDVLQHVQLEHSITHLQKDGSIYNVRPFPELGITVVTWASTVPLQKSWHRQALIWLPAGILLGLLTAALYSAHFAPFYSPLITSYRTLSSIGISRSTISRLFHSKRGKWSGQKRWLAGHRPTEAICRLKFSSHWRKRLGFLSRSPV
ncbi:signal transduction protein [Citrobacter freundii]|nr:signal transduction protein [Citrobacter freundii]